MRNLIHLQFKHKHRSEFTSIIFAAYYDEGFASETICWMYQTELNIDNI